jgi:hypothetical protein
LIKGTIYQKQITMVNIYALNVIACNFIRQIEIVLDIKAQIDPKTIIMGDFDVPLINK